MKTTLTLGIGLGAGGSPVMAAPLPLFCNETTLHCNNAGIPGNATTHTP